MSPRIALPDRVPGGEIDAVIDVQFFAATADLARPHSGAVRPGPIVDDEQGPQKIEQR
jgi:hypothetical protein